MIIEGLVLASITGAGFYFVWHKLPQVIRKFFLRHPLFTDTIACVLTYTLLGGTLTALVAAAWLGCIVSAMLYLVNNPTTSAAMDQLAVKLKLMWGKVSNHIAETVKELQPPVETVE